jgi:hypothetical protein
MSLEKFPKNRKGARNPFCPHYAVCLNEAAKKLWLHLDCSECEFRTNRDCSPDITDYAGSNPFPNYNLPFGGDNRFWQ